MDPLLMKSEDRSAENKPSKETTFQDHKFHIDSHLKKKQQSIRLYMSPEFQIILGKGKRFLN